jgi:hypothetical protein
MEELQDAIEDAQYVNAIATQEDGPRPVLPWDIPDEEQLEAWETQLKSKKSPNGLEAFGLDWTLSSAIGFFLFSAFLKENREDYLRINFSEEVTRWRRMRGKHRVERARRIVEVYLKAPPKDEETGETVLPKKTEIDEYDLTRDPIQLDISSEELNKLYEECYDASKSANCLGLTGSIVSEIHDAIIEMEKSVLAMKRQSSTASEGAVTATATATKEKGVNGESEKQQERYNSLKLLTQSLRETEASSSSDKLFDKAEAIILESLKKDYWNDFLLSEKYKKMKNFLWYQDRPVVPDDFFTMRVLGRGGFGLVTGKLKHCLA